MSLDSNVIRKRSIIICGHKTSVSMEDDFWQAFKEIADEEDVLLGELGAKIESLGINRNNLSSAIRLFVLRWNRDRRLIAAQHAERAAAMLHAAST
jgi:predicted DNA-binding ribbon-helix-helix protein